MSASFKGDFTIILLFYLLVYFMEKDFYNIVKTFLFYFFFQIESAGFSLFAIISFPIAAEYRSFFAYLYFVELELTTSRHPVKLIYT